MIRAVRSLRILALVGLGVLMASTAAAAPRRLELWWAPIPNTDQERFFDDDTPDAYLYFAGGYGSGKTITLTGKMLKLSAMNGGLPILWTVPDFGHVRDTIIPTLQELDPKTETPWFLEPSQFHYFEKGHRLEWVGGGPILFGSAEDAKSIKGPNVAAVGVDEPGSISWEAWRNSVNRVRHPRARLRQKVAAGTWEGFGWLADAFGEEDRPPHYKLYEMDTRQNVELLQYVPDYIQQVMENATEAELQSYLGGKLANLLGTLPYKPFAPKVHYRTDVPFDRALPLCVCYDFNVDPMSCVVAQIGVGRYGPEIRVVTSVIRYASITEEVTKEVVERFGCWQPGYHVYGDATGKARSTSSRETNYDIITRLLKATRAPVKLHVPSANPPVADRINAVNAMLLNSRGHVRLAIKKHEPAKLCPNRELVKSLQQTTYKPGTTEILKKPGETITHPAEALGYLVAKEFPIADHRTVATIKAAGSGLIKARGRTDEPGPAPIRGDLVRLTEDVMRFGSAAVTAVRRQIEPGFELPDHLKGVLPQDH